MPDTKPQSAPQPPAGQRPPLDKDGDTVPVPRPADEMTEDNALEQPATADHGEQQG
ncbi:MAG TPA: hypothetical protein VG839_01885 [Asticcacaulis sp.]|nr:hypothetical protein [Asticcacaulis sp.]